MNQSSESKNACEGHGNVGCVICGELSETTPIFRYIPTDRYFELIEDRINTLTHLTLWEDPFEAYIFRAGITYQDGSKAEDVYALFKLVYGQSWTLRSEESDVVWRAMGKRGDLVRIGTTVGKLSRIFCNCCFAEPNTIKISPIIYTDREDFNNRLVYENLYNAIRGDNAEVVNFFFQKRKEFELEKEVRVIAIPDESCLNKEKCARGHLLKFPIQPEDFIVSVLADPMMKRQKYEEIVCRTRHVSGQIAIERSSLFDWPILTPEQRDTLVLDVDADSQAPKEDGGIPCETQFLNYLNARFNGKQRSVKSVLSRVKRVFRLFNVGNDCPSLEELDQMIRQIDGMIQNPGSAVDCKSAIRHYRVAIHGN